MFLITVLNEPGLMVSYVSKFNFTLTTQTYEAIQFATEQEVTEAFEDIRAVRNAKKINVTFEIIES